MTEKPRRNPVDARTPNSSDETLGEWTRHVDATGKTRYFSATFKLSEPADWNLWSQMPKAALWDAVALSLNVEPTKYLKTTSLPRDFASPEIREFCTEHQRRMRIAQAHLSMSGPLYPLRPYPGVANDPQAEVSLPEFAALAERLGWPLPNRFPRQQTMQTASGEERSTRPMGERERNGYLGIIDGLLGLLLGKTPAGHKQSVFETQTAVIEAMLANYPNRPGISKRNLEEKFAAAKRATEES